MPMEGEPEKPIESLGCCTFDCEDAVPKGCCVGPIGCPGGPSVDCGVGGPDSRGDPDISG